MDWDRYNELVALRDVGRIDEATLELGKLAADEAEPSIKAIIKMAIAYGFSRHGRFSDARREFLQASETVGPNHILYARILLAIAVLEIDQEKWTEALKQLDNIVNGHRESLADVENQDVFEEVQWNRGIALFELHRISEALPLLQSVRSIEHLKDRTLYSIGMSNFELNNFDAAIVDFQELISRNPVSVYLAHAHYHLGRIYYEREQLARAKDEFEKCLACPDRGDLSDEHLLQALVFSSEGLNLQNDAARYSEMLKSIRRR
jgi:tetratricopeptide (TPR) repeat protein